MHILSPSLGFDVQAVFPVSLQGEVDVIFHLLQYSIKHTPDHEHAICNDIKAPTVATLYFHGYNPCF